MSVCLIVMQTNSPDADDGLTEAIQRVVCSFTSRNLICTEHMSICYMSDRSRGEGRNFQHITGKNT